MPLRRHAFAIHCRHYCHYAWCWYIRRVSLLIWLPILILLLRWRHTDFLHIHYGYICHCWWRWCHVTLIFRHTSCHIGCRRYRHYTLDYHFHYRYRLHSSSPSSLSSRFAATLPLVYVTSHFHRLLSSISPSRPVTRLPLSPPSLPSSITIFMLRHMAIDIILRQFSPLFCRYRHATTVTLITAYVFATASAAILDVVVIDAASIYFRHYYARLLRRWWLLRHWYMPLSYYYASAYSAITVTTYIDYATILPRLPPIWLPRMVSMITPFGWYEIGRRLLAHTKGLSPRHYWYRRFAIITIDAATDYVIRCRLFQRYSAYAIIWLMHAIAVISLLLRYAAVTICHRLWLRAICRQRWYFIWCHTLPHCLMRAATYIIRYDAAIRLAATPLSALRLHAPAFMPHIIRPCYWYFLPYYCRHLYAIGHWLLRQPLRHYYWYFSPPSCRFHCQPLMLSLLRRCHAITALYLALAIARYYVIITPPFILPHTTLLPPRPPLLATPLMMLFITLLRCFDTPLPVTTPCYAITAIRVKIQYLYFRWLRWYSSYSHYIDISAITTLRCHITGYATGVVCQPRLRDGTHAAMPILRYGWLLLLILRLLIDYNSCFHTPDITYTIYAIIITTRVATYYVDILHILLLLISIHLRALRHIIMATMLPWYWYVIVDCLFRFDASRW